MEHTQVPLEQPEVNGSFRFDEVFARGVTMFATGIAVVTIVALTTRKRCWVFGLGFRAAGRLSLAPSILLG